MSHRYFLKEKCHSTQVGWRHLLLSSFWEAEQIPNLSISEEKGMIPTQGWIWLTLPNWVWLGMQARRCPRREKCSAGVDRETPLCSSW